jgi:tryptophan halogenase
MKICIIGGGTAGWLAALWIATQQPNSHEITVVESSKIGIIGAGEGTTGIFADIIHKAFKFDYHEFMDGAKATQKLGIRFHNWKGDGTSFIAPIDNTDAAINDAWDYSLMHLCQKYGRHKAALSTVNGALGSRDLSTIHKDNLRVLPTNAYHFDGHQVGQTLKKKAQAEHNIPCIDSEVRQCFKDDRGYITAVKLSNGRMFKADIWVDASGFSRVLGKEVDAGWHSYSDFLTCDRAMPFIKPHKTTISPLTEAYAMNSGWQWNIPTQERLGCGYVYDSRFCSDDQALQELEQHWGEKIDPIKIIKFDPGRVERPFCKNVASIGLAGSFLEPLQATSIHGTLGHLHHLTARWLRPQGVTPEGLITDELNNKVNQGVDHCADLIQVHYRSGRTDTEFWQHQQSLPLRPHVNYIQQLTQHRWPEIHDWYAGEGSVGYGVFIYPMLEYGWLNSVIATQETMLPQGHLEKFEKEQTFINRVLADAMPHTELITRIRNNTLLPTTDVNSQLHPLLRN